MTATTTSSIDTDTEPGRRERKRRQTLDRLARTAFGLFETNGFDAVTMEQIAAEADVAKGTLYNHFPVKEALLAHLFHGELADDMPRIQAAMHALPGSAARLAHLLHASAAWSEAHRTYLPHYLRFRLAHVDCGLDLAGATRHPRSGMNQAFDALIRAGQEAGELRGDLPSEQLANMLQFLHLGALMRWLASPDSDLRSELDAVLDVFMRGSAVPARKRKK